jgi:hypothetical protein
MGAQAFVAGHFGEWLQGRLGPGGPVALVTLACPVRGARASVAPDAELVVAGGAGLLTPERCARFLAALGLPAAGRVRLRADLPPGGGAGMSTAALVALARAAGGAEAGIAQACRAVEGATDPLMLDAPDAVLWAPRRAQALRDLPPPPAAEIVGGFLGPPERTDPADTRFPDISDLVERWAAGGSLADRARLAAASAARTTALRGPAGDPTPALAARLGAGGHARAHTGPARALIFPPGAVPEGAEATLRAAGFAHVLRFRTGGA